MSNINDDGVYMNKKTLAELSFTAVKELRDEVAATCSGGTATLYDDADFGGRSLTFRRSDPNLINNKFNNKTSSIIISKGQVWRFFQGINFTGRGITLRAGAYRFVNTNAVGNDTISSLRRLQ